MKCEFLGIRSIKTAGLAKGWPYYIDWWSFLPPLTNREVKRCFISPLILPANIRYKCALFWRNEISTYISETIGIRGSLLAISISYTCWYTGVPPNMWYHIYGRSLSVVLSVLAVLHVTWELQCDRGIKMSATAIIATVVEGTKTWSCRETMTR